MSLKDDIIKKQKKLNQRPFKWKKFRTCLQFLTANSLLVAKD